MAEKEENEKKPLVKMTSAEMEAEMKQAEFELKRLELAEQRVARAKGRGANLKQDRLKKNASQNGCNHRNGGDGAAGVVGGRGTDAQYSVLKRTFANGDTWIRCLRCGKTWKPPLKERFKTEEAYQVAYERYQVALNFPTRKATQPTQLTNDFIIDPEFRALVPAPSEAERELLRAQIKEQGCLTPLIVWHEENILLDGHNRFSICTEERETFQVSYISLGSRDEAKLWILEHQAGRRNLTDDQRAVIWNEIREQRSAVFKISRAAKAREAKITPISVKSSDIKIKIDTRAAVAKEAHLPEMKLRAAQSLKKYQPELYKRVLAGTVTLRQTRAARTPGQCRRYAQSEFYSAIGQNLHSLFSKVRGLDDLKRIKKADWNPTAEAGFKRLIQNLVEVRAQADKYAKTFKQIVKQNRANR